MTTWYELTYPDSTLDDWDQATYAEADTYHTARGNTTWTGTNDAKTQALQRAWDYMRGLNWMEDVFDTELPDDVKNAQIVAALYELVDPGCLLPTISADDFLEEKEIGPIRKVYKSGSPSRKRFTAIDNLLKPYLVSGTRVVRG